MTPPPPVTLRADGTWRELALHAARQIGPALALPLVLWLFFHTPLRNLLTLLGVGLGLMVLLSWARMTWGRAVQFSAGGLRIERRNGQLLDIPSRELTALRCKTDCLLIAWQPAGAKRQSLVIGRESFSKASWAELLAAVQTLSPATAPAAPQA
jgi:hypothetical protein